jgi:hypothetical protein
MSSIKYVPADRLFGYARVSSNDQDLTIQRERLQSAGCHVVRTEKVSATVAPTIPSHLPRDKRCGVTPRAAPAPANWKKMDKIFCSPAPINGNGLFAAPINYRSLGYHCAPDKH